jgi:hypothetical protein
MVATVDGLGVLVAGALCSYIRFCPSFPSFPLCFLAGALVDKAWFKGQLNVVVTDL